MRLLAESYGFAIRAGKTVSAAISLSPKVLNFSCEFCFRSPFFDNTPR
jgi:hypothetical protein